MLDGLDRIVALKKQRTFSNSIKIIQNNVLFFYFIKLCEYLGNFQSSYETKKIFYGKDNEANAGRNNYVGWTNVCIFASFLNTEKMSLN